MRVYLSADIKNSESAFLSAIISGSISFNPPEKLKAGKVYMVCDIYTLRLKSISLGRCHNMQEAQQIYCKKTILQNG